MHIRITPNVDLRRISMPVESFDDELKKLIDEMSEMMVSSAGVGLAAPQVGVSRRVIVVRGKVHHLVNPRVIDVSQELCTFKEGCLSIPGVQVAIQRPSRVNVEYQTTTGEYRSQWFAGLEARIIQHEIDHLDGILITDRKKT